MRNLCLSGSTELENMAYTKTSLDVLEIIGIQFDLLVNITMEACVRTSQLVHAYVNQEWLFSQVLPKNDEKQIFSDCSNSTMRG